MSAVIAVFCPELLLGNARGTAHSVNDSAWNA